MTSPISVQLLGADNGTYGDAHVIDVGPRTAAGISVGAGANTPSLKFKGDSDVPNEDALCVVESGDWVAMAVADAHFGHTSSHELVGGLLAGFSEAIPQDPEELLDLVWSLGGGPLPETNSKSTLLIAIYHRRSGYGFGTSFGDSTCALVRADGAHRVINTRDTTYVSTDPASLAVGGEPFSLQASRGDLLVLYTDGIDECHYRHPKTSVQPHHIATMAGQTQAQPEQFITQLIELALTGVEGNPGGQDNIAVVATLG